MQTSRGPAESQTHHLASHKSSGKHKLTWICFSSLPAREDMSLTGCISKMRSWWEEPDLRAPGAPFSTFPMGQTLSKHTPFPDPVLCYLQRRDGVSPYNTLQGVVGLFWVFALGHTSRNQNLLWFAAIVMGSAREKENGPELLFKYRMKHYFYAKFGWSYRNWPSFFLWIICCWRSDHFYSRTNEVSLCIIHKIMCFQKNLENGSSQLDVLYLMVGFL